MLKRIIKLFGGGGGGGSLRNSVTNLLERIFYIKNSGKYKTAALFGFQLFKVNRKSQKVLHIDYIISLGNACRPAYYLRENNLRIASNPLDWMMRYSLETVIHLFKTQFSDFFSNVWEDISKYENNKRRYVIDLDTNMIDMHLFPKNLSLEQGKIRHHDIMKRRYERMHNAMLCSNRILFISNRNEPIEQFKNFLLSICGIYHKEITYINIRNSEIESKSQIKFTKKLKFIEYSFRDIHKNGAQKNENKDFWLGNVDKWNNIMQTIELSGKIKP